MSTSETLDARRIATDSRLAEALMAGASVEEAAAAAGCSRATAYRRLRDTRFTAVLDDVRADVFAATADGLASLGRKRGQSSRRCSMTSRRRQTCGCGRLRSSSNG
jgi:hypothetical protein